MFTFNSTMSFWNGFDVNVQNWCPLDAPSLWHDIDSDLLTVSDFCCLRVVLLLLDDNPGGGGGGATEGKTKLVRDTVCLSARRQVSWMAMSTLIWKEMTQLRIKGFWNLGLVVPGCSFHCEHFMENTMTPSIRYRIAWTFDILLTDVVSTPSVLLLFKILIIFGQKWQICWCTSKIWATIQADF